MAGKKVIPGGFFVSFEGPEGSGKSTQISRLKMYFEQAGYCVVVTREPGGTRISEKIRDLLLDPSCSEMLPGTELLLYAASRAQHLGQVIQPALKSGSLVICDRFHDSTTAYQGFGRGIDTELIRNVHCITLNGILPALTFILCVEVATGLNRARTKSESGHGHNGGDRLEQENLSFHNRVMAGYKWIAQQEPERVVLVREGSIEETGNRLITEIERRIRGKS
ncbi:MAG: dTMP kinase [Candidatus Wallbacteria bacterium]|nr:dTMP kinase [Candidatus Wallbacteria bacterium]